MDFSLSQLLAAPPADCACGKRHKARLKDAVVFDGAISETAALIKRYGGTHAYILADENTFAAAGAPMTKNLAAHNIAYTLFLLPDARTEPDGKAVGDAELHFDPACDILLALGTGVINDIAKILARGRDVPFFCIATAPSMDGFASSTSSVIRDGLKVSVNSRCPDVVIADTGILSAAPAEMLLAGLGDMLAKYVSICEWRIGHIVTGEYYCEKVASLIRAAVKKCADNAEGLVRRDKTAVRAVMEGLLLSGIAADWAGVSRPVSGVEHYFSHIWDMRAVAFGTPCSLHGIQCGVGTLYALRGYEALKKSPPDKQKAETAFSSFDRESWYRSLCAYLGKAGDAMVADARTSPRNNPAAHAKRLEKICTRWDDILAVLSDELPPFSQLEALLRRIGAPTKPESFGLSSADVPFVFRATRDVRDKYILSALCFDLGVSEEIAEMLL
ncbi:MAG: sn-glycerol-1-phosphate dehydrogenase [Clostridia bacterium]|nr:sn-glycerol-1-phosphate dehydrogenase [Clostridia bacterium]